jgi:hypothetical protein
MEIWSLYTGLLCWAQVMPHVQAEQQYLACASQGVQLAKLAYGQLVQEFWPLFVGTST